VLNTHTPVQELRLNVTGVQTLTLRSSDAADGTLNDHASWADARIRCT